VVLATIIDYLDEHSGAFAAVLTAVLIAVTTYYAIQNRRMVGEMRKARNAAILPKLALEFHPLGSTAMTVVIKNVGPGAALDLDVRVVYDPVGEGHQPQEARWRRNILASGEQYDFLPPGGVNDNVNQLPATYKAVRLVGTMKDAAGATHDVDEAFDDLAEWRKVLGEAHQRFTYPDAEKRLAEELSKKFARPLKDVRTGLQDVARAVYRLAPPDSDDDPD